MDGGVYDNQGTDSVAIALADESHADLKRADMVAARFVRKYDETPIEDSLGALIISDTPLLNDNIYPAPDQDGKAEAGRAGRLTLGHLNVIAGTVMVLSLLMVSLNLGRFIGSTAAMIQAFRKVVEEAGTVWVLAELYFARVITTETGLNFLTDGMPVIAGISWFIVIWVANSKVITFLVKLPESDPKEKVKLDEKRNKQGKLGRKDRNLLARQRWKDLRDVRISTLREMIGLRLSSTWALTGTIFLNRIRSLGYSLMENRGDLKHRIIKHEIYGIVEQENTDSKHAPSAQMLAVAQRASSMETALWYDHEDQLKDLVACGQFTMCYNLLEYIDKLREAGQDQSLNATLYTKLEADWKKLRRDPSKLIKAMEQTEGGSGNKDSSTGKPKVRFAKA